MQYSNIYSFKKVKTFFDSSLLFISKYPALNTPEDKITWSFIYEIPITGENVCGVSEIEESNRFSILFGSSLTK